MMSSSKLRSRCLYRGQACEYSAMLAVERLLEVLGNSINEVCKLKGWTAAWERAGCDVDARRSSDADDDATKCQRCSPSPLPPHAAG
jgi:hypothetical protein